jgi:hypothetical protein
MYVLAVVGIVLIVCALIAADRALKAVRSGLRRREVNDRLAAVAAEAEEADRQRREASQASGALTSVMPAITEHGPRRVS